MTRALAAAFAAAMLLTISWLSPGRATTSAISLGVLSDWIFIPNEGPRIAEAMPGVIISDLADRITDCCTGVYVARGHIDGIDAVAPEQQFMYLPAVGGVLEYVDINGAKTSFPELDYSSIGPLFPIARVSPDLRVEIGVRGRATSYVKGLGRQIKVYRLDAIFCSHLAA